MGMGGAAATRPTPCLTPLPLVSKVKTEQTATTPQATPQQVRESTCTETRQRRVSMSKSLLYHSRKPPPTRWSAPRWPNGCGRGAVGMEAVLREEAGVLA